jgi:hypothetical protein
MHLELLYLAYTHVLTPQLPGMTTRLSTMKQELGWYILRSGLELARECTSATEGKQLGWGFPLFPVESS